MSLHGGRELQARIDAVGSTRKVLLERLGLRAVFEAKKLVPRKTGNLARTIRVDSVTDQSVKVLAGGTSSVGYASDVEFGTKPHVIVPRRAKALRWASKANSRLSGTPRSGAPVIFRKSVNHPGTKPHPYMVPGAKKAIESSELREVIVETWNRAA